MTGIINFESKDSTKGSIVPQSFLRLSDNFNSEKKIRSQECFDKEYFALHGSSTWEWYLTSMLYLLFHKKY